jgi:hypothetical protein
MICLFGSFPASALTLDANVLGVFEDVTTVLSGAPIAGMTIAPSGDTAAGPFAPGNIVVIGIDVANPAAETIQSIFASLVVQGDQISGSPGTILPPEMLKGPGPSDPSLVNLNSGAVKMGPSSYGSPGQVWVQAVSYALQAGANGTGPDTIQILFELGPGVTVGDFVTFDMGFTAGDSVAGPSSTTFSSAVIQVIPEPGTTLLIGLGLVGLGARRRVH